MRILFSLLFIFVSASAAANTTGSNKLAIVIDDIGYRSSDKSALDLPKQVTFSVLPHTPYGRQLAELGNQQQREILLHVPMESINNLLLGPGAITSKMDKSNVIKTLQASIADIPHIIGVNNHMGSLLTQKSEPMSWTMEVLKDNDLFFLDSRTSRYSQAEFVAQRRGVPTLHRHIFLDNKIDEQYIEQQFKKMIRISQKNGEAIAIGHPHPATMRVLKRLIPTLRQHNIELVDLSTLLPASQLVNNQQSDSNIDVTAQTNQADQSEQLSPQ
ncbi:divergent polysaccharide deacetylase family protein [Thalassotalea sp. HSM 43]|uniref:divergent polysaccharide deacetylase family protein n=1 Tax=Thalassotalea sp. HSM 43 TaxID=2552945 RepID=UPI001081507A|nr:divergent polysaccharide deacetylase family protein [Thalassotalea sp. HSM 43]QBY04165.1 divergent polysaccharide deacetylase family protein [Thalassotalea sp. HSM 43]